MFTLDESLIQLFIDNNFINNWLLEDVIPAIIVIFIYLIGTIAKIIVHINKNNV